MKARARKPRRAPQRPEPLSAFEATILRRLIRCPITAPAVISEELGRPVGPISRAIERLAEKGYIVRGFDQARVLRLPDGTPVPALSARDKARQIEAFLTTQGATKCRTVTLEESCFGQSLWTYHSARKAGAK